MTAADILQIITASAIIQCLCDIGAHYMIYDTKSYHNLLHQLSSSNTKLQTAQHKLTTETTITTTTTTVITTITTDITLNTTKSSTGSSTNTGNKNHKRGISNIEKQQQLVQRLTEEYNHRLSTVALIHTRPFVITGIIFLILMKVLGTEHQNKIIAILPFVPYRWVQRFLSQRGLQQIHPFWFGETNNSDETATIVLQELLSNVNSTYTMSRTAGDTIGSITSMGQICSFTFIYMLTSMSVKYYMNQLFTTPPPKGAESYITLMMDTPQTQAMVQRATGIDPKSLKTE